METAEHIYSTLFMPYSNGNSVAHLLNTFHALQ